MAARTERERVPRFYGEFALHYDEYVGYFDKLLLCDGWQFGRKERAFSSLPPVTLEDWVPADHFYRHLERSLGLRFVRAQVRETYAERGRPLPDRLSKYPRERHSLVILDSVEHVVAVAPDLAALLVTWSLRSSPAATIQDS